MAPSLPQRASNCEARLQQLEKAVAALEQGSAGASGGEAKEQSVGKDGSQEKAQKERILKAVHKNGGRPCESRTLAKAVGLPHDALIRLIQSLSSDAALKLEVTKGKEWILTAEGQKCVDQGSPEAQLFAALPEKGTPVMLDSVALDKMIKNIGTGQLLKAKAVTFAKGSMTRIVDSFTDSTKEQLSDLPSLNPASNASKKEVKRLATVAKTLSKRKLIKSKAVNSYSVTKGPAFSLESRKKEAVVTCASWGRAEGALKQFNCNALGTDRPTGALHPLMKFRQEYRDILIGMGFEEMSTNNFVESTFWNFDALFQPQQHPARDAHDTFYIEGMTTKKLPPAYVDRVKKVHEKGGWRSIGYRNEWSRQEADKLCLRTHTTAVSARYLYEMGQNKPFKPKRCFSIDRVFRNETLDASHLAEFHQVEGFVADYDLNLGHLIGMCSEFFRRVGIPNVKFKPAYNPYTEPSMEIFIERANGKLMEVGNSGLFRPEMLRPMGLPENVKVIAWGFGLERSMMKTLREENIRDLMGPKVKVQKVRKNLIIDIKAA